MSLPPSPVAPLLPKLRGHFAEFLNKGSSARLRIFFLPTCVGFGTGAKDLDRVFSWQRGIKDFSTCFRSSSRLPMKRRDLPPRSGFTLERTLPSVRFLYPSASTLLSCDLLQYRNLNLLSIAYAFQPQLRPRLTLRGRAFLRNPSAFDGRDSHPPSRYSCQHSRLYFVHVSYDSASPKIQRSSTIHFHESTASVSCLDPGIFGAIPLDQ
jgi:hypothetical protein